MEACAIRGNVRFIVLRQSLHATAHTHLLQHLFAVVSQLLVGDEDDRGIGLRASTDGKARTLHAHKHIRSAHDVVRPQSPLLLLRTLSMKAAACLMMMWVRSSVTQMMTIRTRRPMAGGTRCGAGARAVDPWWQGDVVLRGADPAW